MSEVKIVPGVIVQLSGHAARIVRITRDGVLVQIGDRQFLRSFEQIEAALKQS